MGPRPAALAALAAALALPAAACTTFCALGPGGPVFGRNYDYRFGDGLVLVNPRGVAKSSLLERAGARWTARHGSLTFNQFGKDSPAGGINEAGLVVELMMLEETEYPPADSRPALGALEWIQYALDNSASVDEALRGAKRVRIGTRAPLHFLLADRTGDAAAVEFLGGRMVVHRGGDLPLRALANEPYERAREHFEGGRRPPPALPGPYARSLERFATAARLAGELEREPAVDAVRRSFEILDAVAQPGFTQWQVVYDLARGRVHYRTASNREPRVIELARLDFGCASGGAMIDVDTGRGDVTAGLMPYAPEANERLMLASFAKSPEFRQPPAQVRADAGRVEERRCAATG